MANAKLAAMNLAGSARLAVLALVLSPCMLGAALKFVAFRRLSFVRRNPPAVTGGIRSRTTAVAPELSPSPSQSWRPSLQSAMDTCRRSL